jgi:hypothetical protein
MRFPYRTYEIEGGFSTDFDSVKESIEKRFEYIGIELKEEPLYKSAYKHDLYFEWDTDTIENAEKKFDRIGDILRDYLTSENVLEGIKETRVFCSEMTLLAQWDGYALRDL